MKSYLYSSIVVRLPPLHFALFKQTPLPKEPPASVAQLDARPTEDQEVAGSIPAEVGNILSWK